MVITLLTDFGFVDPYVAQMKAVILSLSPDATIVDITHGIEKHNIAMGAHLLKTTAPWFPSDTIHVSVVDPGVGTSRLPIVVDCERGVLIGPDNGLLAGASEVLGFRAAYRITNPEFMAGNISSTFHGRDVFARTAAMLLEGHKPTAVGIRIDKLIHLDQPSVDISQEHVSCHVVYIDSFGNLVTDAATNDMQWLEARKGKTAQLVINGKEIDCVFVDAYSDIPQGKVGMLFGSQGYVEVAQREASAAARFQVRLGDLVEIRFR